MTGRVMLVEDDLGLLERFTRGLNEKGYQVLAYSNGFEALDAIKDGCQYSLLLVDTSLKGRDNETSDLRSPNQRILQFSGRDVIDISLAVNPDIPIVSMSGYEDIPERVRDCLKKPFSSERFFKVVETFVHD